MRTTSTARRSLLTAYRPSAWAVERILGTVMMVAAPLTARTPLPASVWAAMAAGVAGWLAFLVVDRRRPAAALLVLGGSALVTAQTIAATGDGTGVIMVCVALAEVASHTRPAPVMIMGCTAVVVGSAVLGQWARAEPLPELAADVLVVLIVVVLALVRRDYRVKAEHAQRLLEREELARREHARAAALDERTRIARELHDILAHSLGSLAIQLEVADALLSERGDVGAALSRVRRARRLAVDGLAEAGHAVAALRDDVRPLPEALALLAGDHSDCGADPIQVVVDGEPRPIGADACVALLRTAREALTNAARHAPGATVTVMLEYLVDTVRLSIRNGHAPPAPRQGGGADGYGLTGMGERLALAGGTLVAGEDGGGWRVTAEVGG